MSADEHELARMLELYREQQTPDSGVQARVWVGVEASVAPPTPAPQSAPPSLPPPALGAGAKLIGLAAVVTVASGLWLFTAPGERAAPARPATRAVASAPPASPAPAPIQAQPAKSVWAEPLQAERARATAQARPVEPAASGLAQELKLVTAARAAIDAGRPDRALGLLRRHAQRFPQGALSEEREAALVETLCGLGRTSDAAAAAERFVTRFPGSPRSTRVRQACAEAPR